MADKYTVKLYPKALQELEEIYRYIYEVIQVPQYADGQRERLEEGIFSLEKLPYRCAERKTGVYAGKGYRELLVDNYIVIFKIDEKNKSVQVVTIQYYKRNH